MRTLGKVNTIYAEVKSVDPNTKTKQELESVREFYAGITSIMISYQ